MRREAPLLSNKSKKFLDMFPLYTAWFFYAVLVLKGMDIYGLYNVTEDGMLEAKYFFGPVAALVFVFAVGLLVSVWGVLYLMKRVSYFEIYRDKLYILPFLEKTWKNIGGCLKNKEYQPEIFFLHEVEEIAYTRHNVMTVRLKNGESYSCYARKIPVKCAILFFEREELRVKR